MILHEVYKCITKFNYGKEDFSDLGTMLWNYLFDDFKEMNFFNNFKKLSILWSPIFLYCNLCILNVI